MATYGYAGDFSSDDDEKIEQYQERMVQNKFDNAAIRPNKKQIEEEIESIKRLPYDQEIQLNDELLAGLLDYYKTQRGPIVDSTRKLYNKIALRLVRNDQQALDGEGFVRDSSNGSSQQQPNDIIIDNNNSINIISKGPSQVSSADAFSSDDDDVEIVVDNRAKKFDSRVVYDNLVDFSADEEQMEVDSETPTGPVRQSKQVDLPSTDEDEDDESSSEDDSSGTDEELNSGSEAIEVTPIKPPSNANREKEAIEVLMAMRPSTPKQAEASLKKHQMAHSTPIDTAKKPYTRSQRVATRSATRSTRSSEAKSNTENKENSATSADVFLESRRVSRRKFTMVSGAVIVLLLAILAFYFRSGIMNKAEPLLRRKISF